MLAAWAVWAADGGGDGIVGTWHTAEDKSQVEIFKKDNHYFAKITSLKEPNWPADDKDGLGGKPKSDRRNPDPKLRSRAIVGLQIMHDFVYAGKSKWDSGRIYDPENGKTYRCNLTLTSTNRLEVHGYIGVSLLGRTEVWEKK